jgi:predicted dehydrogenase
MTSKLQVACYGTNGHQILRKLRAHPRARLTAVSEIPQAKVCDALGEEAAQPVAIEPDLEALLDRGDVDLVSLCSPRRDRQCEDAIRCMEAGRHVLAEKPAALSVEEISLIEDAARQCDVEFRQMGSCGQEATLDAIRRQVDEGAVGEVVQVYAQKSYPYFDGRPQDRGIDGGLIRQAGIHAVRFIQRGAGLRAVRVCATDTRRGNPKEGELQMAACVWLELEGGAVGVLVLNYLNPRGIGYWGNDQFRVHGTGGMIEAVDGFQRCRMVLGESEPQQIPGIPAEYPDFFDTYVDYLLDGTEMPYSSEEDLYALRTVIRAQEAADNARIVEV